MTTRLPIGQWLIQHGHIDERQLRCALGVQRRRGGLLGEILVDLGFVAERVVLAEVARHLGTPYVDLAGAYVPPAIVRLVPEKIIRARQVFPLAVVSDSARSWGGGATSEPQNLALLDDLSFATSRPARLVLASRRSIEDMILRHLGGPGVAPLDLEILPPPPAETPHALASGLDRAPTPFAPSWGRGYLPALPGDSRPAVNQAHSAGFLSAG